LKSTFAALLIASLTTSDATEGAINWSIGLATSLINLSNRRRRGPRRTRNPEDPPTPHPGTGLVLEARAGYSSTSDQPVVPSPRPRPIPNRDTPRINQANRNLRINQATGQEPYFPSISQPVPVRAHLPPPPVTTVVDPSSSSEEAHRTFGRGTELHCFYPENIYVSSVIPTRNPQELQNYLSHCRTQYEAHSGIEVIFKHELRESYTITTSPLNFQNLLWRTSIVLTGSGIVEEYCRICGRTSASVPDRAILIPVYNVTYGWISDGWTVTRARNPRPARLA
jgi:hypothetical protein